MTASCARWARAHTKFCRNPDFPVLWGSSLTIETASHSHAMHQLPPLFPGPQQHSLLLARGPHCKPRRAPYVCIWRRLLSSSIVLPGGAQLCLLDPVLAQLSWLLLHCSPSRDLCEAPPPSACQHPRRSHRHCNFPPPPFQLQLAWGLGCGLGWSDHGLLSQPQLVPDGTGCSPRRACAHWWRGGMQAPVLQPRRGVPAHKLSKEYDAHVGAPHGPGPCAC